MTRIKLLKDRDSKLIIGKIEKGSIGRIIVRGHDFSVIKWENYQIESAIRNNNFKYYSVLEEKIDDIV